MNPRETKIVEAYPSQDPEIGRWLWALEDTRQRTLEEVNGLSSPILDWQPPDGENSIGTMLYHMADIEADWLYVEVLEQPFPASVSALFSYPTRDAQGHLTQVLGFSLEDHLKRLATVRELLLTVFMQMELADFRRPRSLEYYDVTPEWVLYHLMQHDAEHRSQIESIRARAERAVA